MFQTAGYPTHPSYFDYRSPPRTPTTPSGHQFFSPRHYSYAAATPPRGHARRATQDYGYYPSTNSTPRKTTFYSREDYSSPVFTSAQNTPLRKSEYVDVYGYAPTPANDELKTRPRRSSTTTKTPSHQPIPSRRASEKPAAVKASAEDARRAGIPAGYSYKNWDPSEEPILLLGSVFDANSLGKWIFDWSVYYYGPGAPMTEVAGDLWLLLIKLARKIKDGEDCMPRIRQESNRELVDEFLDSGERLWQRFNKLLKICESYMWRAAKREAAEKQKDAKYSSSERRSSENITMGRNSGCEFVDAIFGRDRELERTEKLMSAMRLWVMRFDANCEEVLKNPMV